MCERGRFSDAEPVTADDFGDDFIDNPEVEPDPPVSLSQAEQRKRRASGALPWK